MKVSVDADLLKTLPCVGKILSMVLMLEIGRVDRIPTAAHLASYAGLVPRVHSSGGHTRMGQVCGHVNRNLKWAFVECKVLANTGVRCRGSTYTSTFVKVRITSGRDRRKEGLVCDAEIARTVAFP
jgi:transposase